MIFRYLLPLPRSAGGVGGGVGAGSRPLWELSGVHSFLRIVGRECFILACPQTGAPGAGSRERRSGIGSGSKMFEPATTDVSPFPCPLPFSGPRARRPMPAGRGRLVAGPAIRAGDVLSSSGRRRPLERAVWPVGIGSGTRR